MTKVRVNVKERVEDNTIDLSLSELTDVPVRDIATFKRATILDLSSNNLVFLGKNFSQLTHLTKLDLSKNQIKSLPEDFGELKNLRHLNLYNNKIENLPLSFGSLTNLKYLDLKGNPLLPTIAKTVGICSTNKECNESAKNTVKYFSLLQAEVEKASEKLRLLDSPAEVKKPEAQKSKKKKKKGKKSKMSNQTVEPKETDDLTSDENKQGDGEGNENGRDGELDLPPLKSMCVFKSILLFCLVLFVNILLVYVLTTKSSDIVEQIVANVPETYRETIITFTDDMRFNYFRVSEWIRKWKTSPTPPLHNANF